MTDRQRRSAQHIAPECPKFAVDNSRLVWQSSCLVRVASKAVAAARKRTRGVNTCEYCGWLSPQKTGQPCAHVIVPVCIPCEVPRAAVLSKWDGDITGHDSMASVMSWPTRRWLTSHDPEESDNIVAARNAHLADVARPYPRVQDWGRHAVSDIRKKEDECTPREKWEIDQILAGIDEQQREIPWMTLRKKTDERGWATPASTHQADKLNARRRALEWVNADLEAYVEHHLDAEAVEKRDGEHMLEVAARPLR